MPRPVYRNSLPTMPLAIFPASPLVEKAVPAILDAWLNLSHREKASELVMVKAMAIAISNANSVSIPFSSHSPADSPDV